MKIIYKKPSNHLFIKRGMAALAFLSIASFPALAQTTISWTGCTGSTSSAVGDAVVAFTGTSCDANAAGFTSETIGTNTVRVAFGQVSGNAYLRNDISAGGTFSYGRFYTANNSLFTLSSLNLVAISSTTTQTITLSAYHNNALVGSITKSFTSGGAVTLPVSSADLGATFTNIDEIRTSTSCSTCNGVGLDDIVIATTPLALNLLSFTGNTEGTSNTLHWITADATNLSAFGIEKSTDGTHFNNIGIVAAGHQANQTDYDFTDETITSNQTNYYRLKITEQSGSYSYSNVIAISGNGFDKDGYKIYPNPSKDILNIKVPASKETVSVVVMDVNGNPLLKQANENASNLSLHVSALPVGFYFVQIKSASGAVLKTLKFQKN